MKKIIIQGLAIIALFFSTWFVLTQVDWMTLFEVKKHTDKTEEKLGDLYLEIFRNNESENKNTYIIKTIDSIVSKICTKNNIDQDLIKVHIINKEDINAFALPNGHLIIYSGLILDADNAAGLSGVIAHEIAHIQLNHVMKKLVKEVGLSVLISMTTGNSGGQIIKETAKILSSTAFDRSLEKEADIKAVDYLTNTNIDPEPFANFLYKLSDKEHEITQYLTWISTHPDSKERARYIIEYSSNNQTDYEPVISDATWKQLKEEIKDF